jgi:hypothetical protein
MDDVEIIHLYGPDGTCYSCEQAPGSFSHEREVGDRVEVEHLCRDCISRK